MGFLWDLGIKAVAGLVLFMVITTIISIVPCTIIVGMLLLIGIFYMYGNSNAPQDENE